MREFPPDYLSMLESLEPAYLQHEDPIRQSGFGGGATRWKAERIPILDAVAGDGDFLDVGCANGYLLACLLEWAHERGVSLVPYGVDLGPKLFALARQRLPAFAENFFVANAWDWTPPQQFRYVYALYDSVPVDHLSEYTRRLLARAVEPGGRLIMGAYGSRSRNTPPFDISGHLRAAGYPVAGEACAGDPVVTAFAWIDKPARSITARHAL